MRRELISLVCHATRLASAASDVMPNIVMSSDKCEGKTNKKIRNIHEWEGSQSVPGYRLRTTILPDHSGLVGNCFLQINLDFRVVLTIADESSRL